MWHCRRPTKPSIKLNIFMLLYIHKSYIHCVQKKNTHSRFLLYLGGKCFDLYKIFRVCLIGIRHSIEVKI